MTKFEMSQKAHKKLADYHSKKYKETEKDEHYIKNGYHNSVYKEQEREKKIISQDRKEKLYSSSRYFYYN